MADTGTTSLVYGRDTVIAWTQAVAARGGLATVFPSQAGAALAGKPAERYPASVISALKLGTPVVWTTGQKFGYYAAGKATGTTTGMKVNAFSVANNAAMKSAITAGNAAAAAEKVAKAFSFGSIAVGLAVVAVSAVALRGK